MTIDDLMPHMEVWLKAAPADHLEAQGYGGLTFYEYIRNIGFSEEEVTEARDIIKNWVDAFKAQFDANHAQAMKALDESRRNSPILQTINRLLKI